MNIKTLEKDLKKYDQNLESGILNHNELYVQTTKENLTSLIELLLKEYKLKFIAEFCHQEDDDFIINTLLAGRKEGYYVIVRYISYGEIISLQDTIFQSNLFEREMADLYGLEIKNGIDTRHLVKHEEWPLEVYPLRKDFPFGEKIPSVNEIAKYEYKPVRGDGYQIFAGPVHAGIIGPGHFRFSAIGESIENLEVRLMYKHRGIEKLAENVDINKLNLVFERVSGDSSVAYSECYALLIEKMMNYTPSKAIQAIRIILLELERIYNYLGDIGGICTDVGFSYPAKKFDYFKELIHQLAERITGSRYMRNSIVPLGINIDFNEAKILDIKATLSGMKERLNNVIEYTLDAATFLDRVENTGMINKKIAKKFSLTGIPARAAGISYDVRKKFSYELYEELKTSVNKESIGGAFERYKLKIAEIRDAFNFIEKATSYINTNISKERPKLNLTEGMRAIASVETVKGELVVYGEMGKDNKFNRIYFKTPSFTNFHGLSEVVLGEIVPDFPLCNKSFNMSYSENDR